MRNKLHWTQNPALLINTFLKSEDYPTKYPDKSATFTRDSPLLTKSDGIGMMELEEQTRRDIMERQKEDMIRQIAGATGQSAQTLRAMKKRRLHASTNSNR